MTPFIGHVKNLVNLRRNFLKMILWEEMTRFYIIFLCIPSGFISKLCGYIIQLTRLTIVGNMSSEWHTSMNGS